MTGLAPHDFQLLALCARLALWTLTTHLKTALRNTPGL